MFSAVGQTVVRWVGVAVLGAAFVSGANALAVSTCSVTDFTAGGEAADACQVGTTANDSLSDVSALFGGDWSKAAKYEEGSGLEAGSTIDLDVWKLDPDGYGWSIPVEALADFSDALFVVKQGNPNGKNPGGWVAYLFQPLAFASGEFFTTNSFVVDDFSHLSLYVRDKVKSVPEIDGASAGVALALLGGLVAIRRERRKFSA